MGRGLLAAAALGILALGAWLALSAPKMEPKSAPDASPLGALLGEPRLSVLAEGNLRFTEMDSGASGGVVVRSGGQLYSIPGLKPLLTSPDEGLESIAVTAQGLIAAVRGAKLGYVAGGGVRESATLPGRGLRLERIDAERLALFGPHSGGASVIYLLERGGKYSKLFTLPQEITALTGTGDGFLFAAEGTVYRVRFGAQLSPVAYLPLAPQIQGLAWDPRRKAAFIAAADSIYVAARGGMRMLAGGISGELLWIKDRLLVLPKDSQKIYALDGVFK